MLISDLLHDGLKYHAHVELVLIVLAPEVNRLLNNSTHFLVLSSFWADIDVLIHLFEIG
jgi:hypothetical protein